MVGNKTDMPNRILRDGILTSPRIAKLGWAAEVFYRRLHSVVDDFGRYHADLMMLRAACYPRQLDKVSDSDIGKWMRETAEAGLVRVYEHNEQAYLELLDFRQQVRAVKSKFPDPPPLDERMPSTCVADAEQMHTKAYPKSETKSETKAEAKAEAKDSAVPRRRGASPKTPIPPDFRVSDRVLRWSTEKGFGDPSAHLESFISKCKAKGYAYADWDEAFMNAIRDDWARLRTGLNGRGIVGKQAALEAHNADVARRVAEKLRNGK